MDSESELDDEVPEDLQHPNDETAESSFDDFDEAEEIEEEDLPAGARPAPPGSKRGVLQPLDVAIHPEVEAAVRRLQAIFRLKLAMRRIMEVVRNQYELVFDDEVGAYFYYNKRTGESQWTKPALLRSHELYRDDGAGRQACVKIQCLFRGILARARVKEILKSRFQKQYDPNSGDFYYSNVLTNETLWKKPLPSLLGDADLEVDAASRVALDRDEEIKKLREELQRRDQELDRVRQSRLHDLEEEDRSKRMVNALRGAKRSKDMDEWTVEHVAAWLNEMEQLQSYCEAIVRNRIDGLILLNMDNDDYVELGMRNKLHQRRLVVALKKYRDRYEKKQEGEDGSDGEDAGSLGSETPSELLDEDDDREFSDSEDSEGDSDDELMPTEEELLEMKQDAQNISISVKFPGNGVDFPKLGDIVRCHYVMYVPEEREKRVVENTRTMRNRPMEFALGIGQVIPGWERAIVKMSVEERSYIKLSAIYAYGEAGAPPLIPPNSPIEIDVELLGIRPREAWAKPLIQAPGNTLKPYFDPDLDTVKEDYDMEDREDDPFAF